MSPASPAAEQLGSFEEQVMLAVARTRGESYGMIVRRELAEHTGRDVAIGAVYATLDRLEAKGLVASKRATVGGMSRRMFEVTKLGLRSLAHTREIRDRLWKGLDLARLGLRGT